MSEIDAVADDISVTNAEFIEAVTQVWAMIREVHSEVSAVRVAVGVRRNAREGKRAHYGAAHGNAPAELYISPRLERETPEQVVATLLHEACHSVAEAREIQDTSDRGRHHNARFANLAAELGLYLNDDRPASLGASTLGPAALSFWQEAIDIVRAAQEQPAE